MFNKLVILVFLGFVFGCGDTATCVDTETSLVKVQFIDEDRKSKEVVIIALTADGNNDGFPEYQNDTTSTLILPLNPGTKSVTFYIEQSNTTDTLVLSYDVVARLVSPECGLDASFSDLDTISTSFENLFIVQKIIADEVPTNIEITL